MGHHHKVSLCSLVLAPFIMAPMKAMKATKAGVRPMTKGALAEALAAATEIKRKEGGEVRAPRLVHDQDALEASDQGGQEGGLRERGDGQGQAGEDHCEGVPGLGLEEEHLRRRFFGTANMAAVRSILRSGLGSAQRCLLGC